MVFNKPYNEDERAFIRRNWGHMTSGAIAQGLNTLYRDYNNGERTDDGVRTYINEMTGAKVEVELPRAIRDQLKDNGHDPVKVGKAIEKSVNQALKPLISNNGRSKAKAS